MQDRSPTRTGNGLQKEQPLLPGERWKSLQGVSLLSPESQAITLVTATSRDSMPLLRLCVAIGEGQTLLRIGELLAEADMITGGKCGTDELELMARMTLMHFRHRSVESLILAIREGMVRTDDEGKVYGKLKWPTLLVWLNAHEDKVLGLAMDDHSRSVVKNDNLGADYLDRVEHAAGGNDRTIAAQGRLIDDLRRRLDNRQDS